MKPGLVGLICAGALCAFGLVYANTAPAPKLAGIARVIDGDTIVIANKHIRLFGIDAPESEQTCLDENNLNWFCGNVATMALSFQIGGKQVTCDQQDTDRYGRIVAICYVDGHDIGSSMVRQGYAVDYRTYSHGLYATEERAAWIDRIGIWKGTFEMPERWRHEHKGQRR